MSGENLGDPSIVYATKSLTIPSGRAPTSALTHSSIPKHSQMIYLLTEISQTQIAYPLDRKRYFSYPTLHNRVGPTSATTNGRDEPPILTGPSTRAFLSSTAEEERARVKTQEVKI